MAQPPSGVHRPRVARCCSSGRRARAAWRGAHRCRRRRQGDGRGGRQVDSGVHCQCHRRTSHTPIDLQAAHSSTASSPPTPLTSAPSSKQQQRPCGSRQQRSSGSHRPWRRSRRRRAAGAVAAGHTAPTRPPPRPCPCPPAGSSSVALPPGLAHRRWLRRAPRRHRRHRLPPPAAAARCLPTHAPCRPALFVAGRGKSPGASAASPRRRHAIVRSRLSRCGAAAAVVESRSTAALPGHSPPPRHPACRLPPGPAGAVGHGSPAAGGGQRSGASSSSAAHAAAAMSRAEVAHRSLVSQPAVAVPPTQRCRVL